MEANDQHKSTALEHPQYFWEEYKYRHDLIWQRVFRFTTAIVLISIVPYVEQDLARLVREWILIAPLLAILLAGFILAVMRNELDLFWKIKEAHRRQQNELLDDDLKHKLNAKSSFEWFVMLYLASLGLLSILNGYMMWQAWLPRLLAQPACPDL
jgi:hypothetical protein